MKNFLAIALAALLATLTSCLTIEESYTFKPNGSGTMEYKIDMSEMAPLLKMASEEGEEPIDEDLNISELADKLIGIKGISKVASTEDKENFIFTVSFSFSDIDALNTAMNAILSDGEPGGEEHTFFTQEEKKTFKRVHRMNEAFNPDEILGEEEEGSEYAMTLMESMKYRLNFQVKRPVKAVYSSADVEYMDEKHKTLRVETSLKNLMEDPKALDVTLVTK